MSANSSSRGKSRIESVEFKPLHEGGVMSVTRKITKRGGQGGGPMEDYDHEERAHSTLKDAHAHMTRTLGGSFGVDDSTEEE